MCGKIHIIKHRSHRHRLVHSISMDSYNSSTKITQQNKNQKKNKRRRTARPTAGSTKSRPTIAPPRLLPRPTSTRVNIHSVESPTPLTVYRQQEQPSLSTRSTRIPTYSTTVPNTTTVLSTPSPSSILSLSKLQRTNHVTTTRTKITKSTILLYDSNNYRCNKPKSIHNLKRKTYHQPSQPSCQQQVLTYYYLLQKVAKFKGWTRSTESEPPS